MSAFTTITTGGAEVNRLVLSPAPSTGTASYGALLSLIRAHPGLTRAELLDATGMSRTTLFERLEVMFRHQFIVQVDPAPVVGSSKRGRRSQILRWNTAGRVVLVLDLGQTRARIAIAGVDGTIVRVRQLVAAIAIAPHTYLERVFSAAQELLDEGERELLMGVAVGIPGPVNPSTGVLGESTTMRQWKSFDLLETIQQQWGVVATIENDARAMALGEAGVVDGTSALLAIKYATGIGAGIADQGRLLEGFDGAAGDIGHVRITKEGPECTCGRQGCLAAWASGHALVRDLAHRGVRDVWDVAELVRSGDPEACQVLETAADRLAEVLATIVAATNPEHLVLGGVLGRLPNVVARVEASLRENVNERARLHLVVASARLGVDSESAGLVQQVVNLAYAPARVDAAVSPGRTA